jgi:hypothetical protein
MMETALAHVQMRQSLLPEALSVVDLTAVQHKR